MNTVAWLFIFAAGVLIDAVRRGRADDLPEDVTDTFVALVTLDGAKLREVSQRKGEGLTAGHATVSDSPGAYAAGAGGASGAALLAEARRLGDAAQGYSQNPAKRTGPDFYDCSGLVFRAAKNIGAYKGGSFNTQSFVVLGRKTWQPVTEVNDGVTKNSEPQVGDVVLWQFYAPAHMGIVSGPDKYYSARSRKSGIGESSISGHGGTPRFYRLR